MALEVVYYTKISPSERILLTEDEECKKNLILAIQGEAIEVSEEHPIPVLMILLDLARRFCPEMVLKLKNEKRVLIFDHWGKKVIREKNIIKIPQKIKNEKEKKFVQKFVPEIFIDPEALWRKNVSGKDDLEKIKKTLKKIKEIIKPCQCATLFGKGPVLLYLLSQYLLYGKAVEIWYQEEKNSQPIKISTI